MALITVKLKCLACGKVAQVLGNGAVEPEVEEEFECHKYTGEILEWDHLEE